jgi:two-component system NarL family response regulator
MATMERNVGRPLRGCHFSGHAVPGGSASVQIQGALPSKAANERSSLARGSDAATSNLDPRENGSRPNSRRDTPFTVLLADDHPLVREGLAVLINRQSDMRVIGEARNGQEAVEKFFALRPDIVLLDLRMPAMDGIETVTTIVHRYPTARIVILTSYQSEEDVYRALRAGARGYVVKDSPVPEVLECIRAVRGGGTWIPAGVAAKLARRVGERELTARETEVLHAITRGKSNKEIGSELNISEATVKVHVTHILEKLKASGRTEAIRLAVERGLVHMDSNTAA